MRHRIYWLLPDVGSARRVMNDLLLARMEERHLHFMARDGIDLSGLHEASVLQSSDLVCSAQRGLMLGAALGAAAGAAFAASSMFDNISEPSIVATLAAIGALFGAWAASMIGASIPNRRLARFKQAMERGEILLMADVPHTRMQEIEALLQSSHPEAHFEGEEPRVPVFP